jgi:RNA polymerase sigma factor (sigma-70 family)
VEALFEMRLAAVAGRSGVESRADAPTFESIAAQAPTLLAAARLLMHDEAEAHDLAQMTCEIAMKRLDTLRDPTRIKGWLLTIQMHEAFRLRRRLRRVVTTSYVPERADGHADHAEVLAVRDAVRRLPMRMRAAVVLHHMVGLTVGETAVAMGISEDSVKSQLKTGLQRLREILL